MKGHLSLRTKDKRLGYLLITPAMIILSVIIIYPMVYSFYISLYNMNVSNPAKGMVYVGFKNTIEIITDPSWWLSILRTFYFVLADIFVGMTLGLLIALLLNRKLPLKGVIFAIVLFPYVLAPIVNALMWKLIYDPEYGFLNGILYSLGIINNYIPWLSNPKSAIIMLIIANLWQGTPFAVILFLSGLKSIPQEQYEAADIDGATKWQSFLYITLPSLRNILYITAVMKTILTFKIFDIVYALTGGGPANSTEVVSIKIYHESFSFLRFGKASAMSYILLIIVLGFILFYLKIFGNQNEQT